MIKHLFLYNIKYISISYPKKKKIHMNFREIMNILFLYTIIHFFFIKLRVIMDNKKNSLLLKDI